MGSPTLRTGTAGRSGSGRRKHQGAQNRTNPILSSFVLVRDQFPFGAYLQARYRKVTTWARLQAAVGPKVVSVRPLVMPFSTAHSMGTK